ncbi:hypothetical protein DFQ30_002214 [Apophysomyces sp. BC1015]|nr:hypothetical protein DFQ30_002214 [Apophysomyces sp. BC1015]
MNYVVDEEVYTLDIVSSHTEYLRNISCQCNSESIATHVLQAKRYPDICMGEVEPKRVYTTYIDQDKYETILPCLFCCELKTELESHINVTHLNKHSHEENEDTTKPTKRANIVSIPGERHVYTSAAADEIFIPNLPKFIADSILKLKDIVTIAMPSNRFLSNKLKTEAADQQYLESLK